MWKSENGARETNPFYHKEKYPRYKILLGISFRALRKSWNAARELRDG